MWDLFWKPTEIQTPLDTKVIPTLVIKRAFECVRTLDSGKQLKQFQKYIPLCCNYSWDLKIAEGEIVGLT